MNAPRQHLIAVLLAVSALLGACQGGSNEAESVAAAKSDIAKLDYKSAIIRAKNALQANAQNGEARLLLGQALLETGDPVAAALELRKALELGTPETQVVPLLAKAMLVQGESRAVILQFASTSLADAAASADLKTTLASAYAMQNERDNALETVLAALKDWPQYAPATLLHARILAAGDNVPGAVALVDALLVREPKNANALLLKGDLQRGPLQQRDNALASYRAAAEANPTSVTAHASIISLLLDQRDLPGAKAQLALLKAAHPNHPETRLFEAQMSFLDKDYAKTRDIAGLLLKVAPNDPRVLQLAGAAEMRLGALAAAESYFGQVLKLVPRALAPRQTLAQIYLRSGQPEKAVEVLQPVLDGGAADANSLTLAGQAYLQRGDMEKSEAAFARAAKVDPKSTTARTALALSQLSKGKTSDGFAELEAVAAEDSGSRANLALISARLRSNDLDGALKAIDALEKKQPNQPLAHVLRGNVQVRRKDMAAATASFEKALALDKQYFPAAAALAALDMTAGKADAAKTRFDDLLKTDPKNPRALLALAELKARTGGSKDDVTKSLGEAVRANPSELAPRVLLVRYLVNQRDYKAALVAAQDAAAALPNSPEVLDTLGGAQLAAGQTQQAVSTFVKLAAMRPAQPEPEMRLAAAYVAANELDAAKRSLDRALRIKPGLQQAQLALAEVALLQKNPGQAMDIALALQKAQPKSPVGFLVAAGVESQRRKPDAAAAALRQAIALGAGTEAAIKLHGELLKGSKKDDADKWAATWKKDHPRDAAFIYYLGDAALARNDVPAAEAHYRAVLELQPDNALALNNVSWLLTRQQKPGAVAMAERANQLMPDQPALMDTLASALASENQTPRAIELQKKAVAQAPEDGNLRLNLARLYIKAGDKPQARTELDSLSKLGTKFPGQAEVAQLIQSL